MSYRCPHFRTGIATTLCCAILGLQLAKLPVIEQFGPLTATLFLGMLWRAFLHVPDDQQLGIGFSSRTLLRWGIILLGVRLDFGLIAKAGWGIFFVALGVVVVGLLIFNLLGKWFGLPGNIPMLIAVDSSICGASAVAATAPVIKAKEDETALVIPIGSVFGSIAVVGYTFMEHWVHLPPKLYGILTGATLHEIAQVMAAGHAVNGALEAGTITKLMRVLLLVPVIFFVGWRQKSSESLSKENSWKEMVQSFPWFVVGFLAVGLGCSLFPHLVPQASVQLELFKQECMTISVFLMAMAMAGVGLQVNFHQLRASGGKAVGVAVIGWGFLVLIAFGALHFFP